MLASPFAFTTQSPQPVPVPGHFNDIHFCCRAVLVCLVLLLSCPACPACRSLAVSGAVRRYLPAGGHRNSEAQAAEHCSCENGYLLCTCSSCEILVAKTCTPNVLGSGTSPSPLLTLPTLSTRPPSSTHHHHHQLRQARTGFHLLLRAVCAVPPPHTSLFPGLPSSLSLSVSCWADTLPFVSTTLASTVPSVYLRIPTD